MQRQKDDEEEEGETDGGWTMESDKEEREKK